MELVLIALVVTFLKRGKEKRKHEMEEMFEK